MKKQLILHIGMGKTGTTTLQQFLWRNRAVLAEAGFHYPVEGLFKGSGAHHFLSPYHPPEFARYSRDNFMTTASWCEQVSRCPEPSVLASSELMAWATPEAVSGFCAELSRVFQLRVVVYVRRQDDMIMSNYKQLARAGTAKLGPAEHLPRKLDNFDYLARIEPWVQALGAQAVAVRPYEREQLRAGDIKADFLEAVLGLEADERFEYAISTTNESLSTPAALFKLLVNQLALPVALNTRCNNLLNLYDRSIDSSVAAQKLLSYEQRNHILEQAAAGNQRLAQTCLGREDGALFHARPNPQDRWYGDGLKPVHCRAILALMARRDPLLYRELQQRVEIALASDKPRVAACAGELQQHLCFKPGLALNSLFMRLRYANRLNLWAAGLRYRWRSGLRRLRLSH